MMVKSATKKLRIIQICSLTSAGDEITNRARSAGRAPYMMLQSRIFGVIGALARPSIELEEAPARLFESGADCVRLFLGHDSISHQLPDAWRPLPLHKKKRITELAKAATRNRARKTINAIKKHNGCKRCATRQARTCWQRGARGVFTFRLLPIKIVTCLTSRLAFSASSTFC